MLAKLEAFQPYALSLMRIVFGCIFVQHGVQKWFGLFGGVNGSPAALWSLFWFAGVIETIGGTLMTLGLFTRPVGFALSGHMAVAYFLSHAPLGFWPLTNGGEEAALYSFAFLFLATAGGGDWSLDRLLSSRNLSSKR